MPGSAMQGRPVYIQILGKIDMQLIKKATNEDRMLKFHIQVHMRQLLQLHALVVMYMHYVIHPQC